MVSGLLFSHDPIYRVGVILYEKLSLFWYIVLTFSYMFIIPFALRLLHTDASRHATIERAWDLIRADPGLLIIFGIMPIVGSVVGYNFFRSIYLTLERLRQAGTLTDLSSIAARERISAYSNGRLVTSVSVLLVGAAFVYSLTLSPKPMSLHLTVESFYMSAIVALWWYFVAKGGLISLIVVTEFGRLVPDTKISLLHEDGFLGLRPIGELSWCFLGLYCGILVFSIRNMVHYGVRGRPACYGRTLRKISLGVLIQAKGVALAFQEVRKRSMAARSWATEPKLPRRTARRERMLNHASIWLSQEAPVGVK